MARLKDFFIRRKSQEEWEYLIELVDDGGTVTTLAASVEDLDRMSMIIDEKLDEMVEAAERLSLSTER